MMFHVFVSGDQCKIKVDILKALQIFCQHHAGMRLKLFQELRLHYTAFVFLMFVFTASLCWQPDYHKILSI